MEKKRSVSNTGGTSDAVSKIFEIILDKFAPGLGTAIEGGRNNQAPAINLAAQDLEHKYGLWGLYDDLGKAIEQGVLNGLSVEEASLVIEAGIQANKQQLENELQHKEQKVSRVVLDLSKVDEKIKIPEPYLTVEEGEGGNDLTKEERGYLGLGPKDDVTGPDRHDLADREAEKNAKAVQKGIDARNAQTKKENAQIDKRAAAEKKATPVEDASEIPSQMTKEQYDASWQEWDREEIAELMHDPAYLDQTNSRHKNVYGQVSSAFGR